MEKQLVSQATEAGYKVQAVEQVRSNRWLLRVVDHDGTLVFVLAQQRRLLTAADVQDLAELLRLYRVEMGFLLAVGGSFSAEAQRTAQELRRPMIQLCTALPTLPSAPRFTPALETL